MSADAILKYFMIGSKKSTASKSKGVDKKSIPISSEYLANSIYSFSQK
jgi:hypothetical protein